MLIDSRHVFFIWEVHLCDSSGDPGVFMMKRVEKTVLVLVADCMIVASRAHWIFWLLWLVLFRGSQDGSDILSPLLFLLRLCFPRFQPRWYRTGAQKIMIDISSHDIPGFGLAFSCCSSICGNVSPLACPYMQSLPLWQVRVMFSHTVKKALLVSGVSCGSHGKKCHSYADVPSYTSCHHF